MDILRNHVSSGSSLRSMTSLVIGSYLDFKLLVETDGFSSPKIKVHCCINSLSIVVVYKLYNWLGLVFYLGSL